MPSDTQTALVGARDAYTVPLRSTTRTTQMAHESHSSIPDTNVIFELSSVPSLILSPSYTILRASKAFLDAWKVTSETCNGNDLFKFLTGEDLMAGVDKVKYFEQMIEEAITARAVRTTG